MEISLVSREHPDDDIWEEYVFGRLPDQQVASLEEHLLVCERCQRALERADEFVRLMKVGTAEYAARAASGGTRRRFKVLAFSPRARTARAASVVAAVCAAVALGLGPLRPAFLGRTGLAPRGGPVSVELRSYRAGGATAMNRAPARHPLDLSVPLSGLPASTDYRFELADTWGKTVWSGAGEARDGNVSAHMAASIGKGQYWVRLYGGPSELLAEYGLEIQ